MDKKTGFLVILVFALIVTGLYNLYHFRGRRNPRPAVTTQGSGVATDTGGSDRDRNYSTQRVPPQTTPQNLPLALPEGWGRSPFLTPEEAEEILAAENFSFLMPLPEYEVTSILIGDAESVAVIDGMIVRLGDPIGREIVKEISTDGVKLAMGEDLRTIRLRQGGTEVRTRLP